MNHQPKCQLTVCSCKTQPSDSFCSDACRQASSQGVEREFCQCSHENCHAEFHAPLTVDAIGFSDSFRFFASGQITIEYENRDDLIHQLLALADTLSARGTDGSLNSEGRLDGRPALSETRAKLVSSQSA